MMKNFVWIVLLAITFGACNDDEGIELAEVPIRFEFEIPAGLNTVEDHFFEVSNILNITDQVLDGRGVDIADVTIIQPKSARMSVLNDNTQLSFIDECSVSLFSNEVGRKSEAFWTPQIPLNQNSVLDIPGTLIDAKDFLEQERLNFEVRLDTRTINSQFINIRMEVSFSVRGE